MNLRRLLNTSFILAFLYGLEKVIGFLVQRLVNQTFGLGPELDAFNVANTAPDTLYNLISGGALAMALIPVLTETFDREGATAFWRLFSLVANWALVITASLSVGLAFLAQPIVQFIIAPEFTPDQLQLTTHLMRLYLLITLIFSLSGLVIGGLQARQHFWLPALAPILYNLGRAVGVLVLVPYFGVYGLVYGIIFGALCHLAIQLPGLWRYGFRWTPGLDARDPGVRRVAKVMFPRVITLLFINLVFIYNERVASGLGTGQISALALGWQLLQLPETLIGTALATVLLPTFADLVARNLRVELKQLLQRAVVGLLALTLPVTAIGWLVLPWAVRLVFQGEAFTEQNAVLVVWATQLYLLGLAGHSLKEITARTFYALQDARTPVFTALLMLVTFIILSTLLTPYIGFAALALANSIAFTLEAVVMLLILRRRGVL